MNKSEYQPQPRLCNALFFWTMQGKEIATLHDWKDGRYVKPRALSRGELEEIINLDKKDETPTMYNAREIATDTWWCPAKRRPISIDRSDRKVFNHPTLVFKVRNGGLFVGMLKKDERPKKGTMVYEAPYYGVDLHKDKVGLCGVKKPTTNNIEEWEKAFFFSSFNNTPKKKGYKALTRIESWI